MSMSPIRLIAYSPYTFSRFFNGAIGKHPDVRFSVGAIGKHPDEVYVKRKRKSFFRACINRSPRRIHAVLQFENEGGVIDKKLLQILLFRGKLVVNSSFGLAAGADSSRQSAHMRANAMGPNSFFKKAHPQPCF